MARLESESKGGFYPTPPEEMELILKRIKGERGSNVTILDPCCGEGLTLKQVQNHLFDNEVDSVSYGIELEKSRANKAKKELDHVISCGYEETRLSHGAFSFMYLNPPFAEFQGERTEKIFFRDLTKPNSYLSKSALVVLNIPQNVLGTMANLISLRLENVKVYRFTDENFSDYNQVIVYGYRKAIRRKDDQLKEHLENLSMVISDFIPTLDTEDWNNVQYTIKQAEKEVALFDTSFVEAEDIIRSMNETDVMEQINAKIENPKLTGIQTKNPAMPLKVSHMATAIAAGALPEKMGDHLLVGITKTKVTEKTDVDVDTGKEKDTKTFQSKSIVRVFSEQGIFDLQ